jgi:hypothetical protein
LAVGRSEVMPELVEIKTLDFEMSVWCKNVDKSQTQLSKTMASRGLGAPLSKVFFSPAVYINASIFPLGEYSCQQAAFFENKLYDIEFIFDDQVQFSFDDHVPVVRHPLQAVEDSFRYNPKTGSLRATINTANDIGWFRFVIEYQFERKIKKQNIAFEILPTKMDMATDLEQINKTLDESYPLWRFSLAEKTQQGHRAVRQPRQEFLLLWLAQFKSLWTNFEHGLRHITNAPHSRLVKVTKTLKVHQLKGRLGPRLEREVKEAINNGALNKRFKVNKKQLTIDTVENRFIKHVIHHCMGKLELISDKARVMDEESTSQRLSGSFFSELIDKRHSLLKTSRHSMFLEVSDFKGLARESLVLQQKPGYAKVYRAWQQLRWYLDLLGEDASLSVRNVAELYEVWCFLQIHDILLKLGFNLKPESKGYLVDKGLRVDMVDGLKGSFDFTREDGIQLKLTHEPRFHEGTGPIRTWRTTQKPDIVLSATFSDGREHMWVFDAKYRIESDKHSTTDLVPDDAINQMHRYRDALIHFDSSAVMKANKSRPVFGAYVLYPGFYVQPSEANPYQESIDEIGIGAFSLLPSSDYSGSYWLQQFLQSKLGITDITYPHYDTDNHFVEESARIPYRGTEVSLYRDLTIVFSGSVPNRTEDYQKNQREGKLGFYHTRLLATERQKIERHVINEVRYLSVAIPDVDNSAMQSVQYVYPVSKVELIKRVELTEEQAGTIEMNSSNQNYWLFTLGESIKISEPLLRSTPEHFEVLLTDLNKLREEREWDELPQRYPLLIS